MDLSRSVMRLPSRRIAYPTRNSIRIRETEVEKLQVTCAAVPIAGEELPGLPPPDSEAYQPAHVGDGPAECNAR